MDTFYAQSEVAGTGGVEKGRLVKLDTGTVVHCAAITDVTYGVALHSAAAGELVAVAVNGVVDVRCAAALTKGGRVMSNANGRAADASGATALLIGEALETGAAASGSDFTFAKIRLYDNRRIALG